MQFCDGVGIARLLNATLVLPKFEVAAYWNESRLVMVLRIISVFRSTLTILSLRRDMLLKQTKTCFHVYLL